jgi:hypothetical protein
VGSDTVPESVAVVVASCALDRMAQLARKASKTAIPIQRQRDRCPLFVYVFKV